MNENILKGSWKKLKGEAQLRWGKLTNDELDQIEGSRDKLIGAVQKSYGLAQEDAEKEVQEWEGRQAA